MSLLLPPSYLVHRATLRLCCLDVARVLGDPLVNPSTRDMIACRTAAPKGWHQHATNSPSRVAVAKKNRHTSTISKVLRERDTNHKLVRIKSPNYNRRPLFHFNDKYLKTFLDAMWCQMHRPFCGQWHDAHWRSRPQCLRLLENREREHQPIRCSHSVWILCFARFLMMILIFS